MLNYKKKTIYKSKLFQLIVVKYKKNSYILLLKANES